jgi:hypothetical protein
VKKAQAREELDKLCRATRKAGLPELESPEASISEGEEREDPHWLNELLEEESLVWGDWWLSETGHRLLGVPEAPLHQLLRGPRRKWLGSAQQP